MRDEMDDSAGRLGVPPASREPVFNIPVIVLAFLAALAGVHLVRTYLLTQPQDIELLVRAAFIPARYTLPGGMDVFAYTSPLTYSLLHGGMAHLLVNSVWLAAFGSPLAARIGPLRFVAFWSVTALAAVALHYVMHPGEPVPVIGASGSISGMMGAAARFGFARPSRGGGFTGQVLPIRSALSSRTVMTFLAVWFAVNLATGLIGMADGPQIAWEAHIGGFLAGFLLVSLFVPNRLGKGS